MYDIILAGAGLYNAIIANEARKKGKKCLVIEKRNHIGGNCYTERIEGINVHKYGAHIFRTSDRKDGGLQSPAVSTCRAGNVIGGGDFANDRIIPDCVRAVIKGEKIKVRNPYSVRPYQHVLEPVCAYLMIAKEQYNNAFVAGAYNIGPNERDCISTGNLVQLFCDKWNSCNQNKIDWINEHDGGPHEANFLKLDCSKIKTTFNWSPKWNIERAMEKIVEWNIAYLGGEDIRNVTDKQILEYLEG